MTNRGSEDEKIKYLEAVDKYEALYAQMIQLRLQNGQVIQSIATGVSTMLRQLPYSELLGMVMKDMASVRSEINLLSQMGPSPYTRSVNSYPSGRRAPSPVQQQ